MNNYKRTLLVMSLVIATSIISVGCSKAPDKQSAKVIAVETPKIYKQGEEAFILDNSGKQMYSIKIDNITVANDYIYKKESNFDSSKEIVAMNYTYKNIAKTDETLVEISADDLILSDTTGSIGLASNEYIKGLPKPIPVGTNLTIQCHYGLVNKSDKVKISFTSPSYKKNGTITFEIPVK